MFNSATVYELAVLKGYAEPLLRNIHEDSPMFGEAQRLLTFLHYVPFMPADGVQKVTPDRRHFLKDKAQSVDVGPSPSRSVRKEQ